MLARSDTRLILLAIALGAVFFLGLIVKYLRVRGRVRFRTQSRYFLQEGQLPEALKAAERGLRAFPSDAELLELRDVALMRLEESQTKHKREMPEFRAAPDSDASHTPVRSEDALKRAMDLLSGGDVLAAHRLLADLLRADPNNVRARELLNALEVERRERQQREAHERVRASTAQEREGRVLHEQTRRIPDENQWRLLNEALQAWLAGNLLAAEHILHEGLTVSESEIRSVVRRWLEVLAYERTHPGVTEFVQSTLREIERIRSVDLQKAIAVVESAVRKMNHPLLEMRRDVLHYEVRTGGGDRTAVPEAVAVDDVHFTVTGPSVMERGTTSEIQFWIHLSQQRQTVLEYARQARPSYEAGPTVKSEGPFPVRRGARISVRLSIEGLVSSDAHKWITWTGEIGSTTFVIRVPSDAAEGGHRGVASIRLDGCRIAQMEFVLYVGKATTGIAAIPADVHAHKRAFASYSSVDRFEVLARVQGMEAAYRGLKVFVDVIDLRSAQYWETELCRHIRESDVFYLFWCRHALGSEWVEREWRYGLALKGLDFIDPVPLEGPEHATPPSELSAKQFNDPLLAFIAAAGGSPHDI